MWEAGHCTAAGGRDRRDFCWSIERADLSGTSENCADGTGMGALCDLGEKRGLAPSVYGSATTESRSKTYPTTATSPWMTIGVFGIASIFEW